VKEKLESLVSEMIERHIYLDEALGEFEKKFIAHVLEKSDGNLCKAATMLGMHRNTLSRKISEYRLRRPA